MIEENPNKLITKTFLKAFGDKCKQIFCATGTSNVVSTRLVVETSLSEDGALPILVLFVAADETTDETKYYEFQAFVNLNDIIGQCSGKTIGGFGVFYAQQKLNLLFELPDGFTLAKVYVSSYALNDLENVAVSLRVPEESEEFTCSPYTTEFERDIDHTKFNIEVEGHIAGTKEVLEVDDTRKAEIKKVWGAYLADKLTSDIEINLTGDVTGTGTLTSGNTSVSIETTCSKSGGSTYSAGNNISISDTNVISATDTTYTAGTNITISEDNVISATDTVGPTYSAGTNITISEDNVISAVDTTYRGDNSTIKIENGVISFIGTAPAANVPGHLKIAEFPDAQLQMFINNSMHGIGFADNTSLKISASADNIVKIKLMIFNIDEINKRIVSDFRMELISSEVTAEDLAAIKLNYPNWEDVDLQMVDLITASDDVNFGDEHYQLMLCGVDPSTNILTRNVLSGLFSVQNFTFGENEIKNYINFGGDVEIGVHGDCLLSIRFMTNKEAAELPYPPVLVLDFHLEYDVNDATFKYVADAIKEIKNTKIYMYSKDKDNIVPNPMYLHTI